MERTSALPQIKLSSLRSEFLILSPRMLFLFHGLLALWRRLVLCFISLLQCINSISNIFCTGTTNGTVLYRRSQFISLKYLVLARQFISRKKGRSRLPAEKNPHYRSRGPQFKAKVSEHEHTRRLGIEPN
jgi:hypothetical protein